MGSIKMNDWKFRVDNAVVEVEKFDSNMGMYELVKTYYIDAIMEVGEKEMEIKTYKTFTIPKEIMETLQAYLRTMKQYPKNQKQPF